MLNLCWSCSEQINEHIQTFEQSSTASALKSVRLATDGRVSRAVKALFAGYQEGLGYHLQIVSDEKVLK